jgi:Recombination endonuclease VII
MAYPYQIKWQYGLEWSDYLEMLSKGCNLCGKELKRTGKYTAIDHDHATGRVRGVVCTRCNNYMKWVDQIGIEKLYGYTVSPSPTVTVVDE